MKINTRQLESTCLHNCSSNPVKHCGSRTLSVIDLKYYGPPLTAHHWFLADNITSRKDKAVIWACVCVSGGLFINSMISFALYIYIYIHTHAYIYIYIYIYVHTHTHTYIYTQTDSHTHTQTHTHIYIYIYTQTHTHTHTHSHIYICIYIYIYI